LDGNDEEFVKPFRQIRRVDQKSREAAGGSAPGNAVEPRLAWLADIAE
jgi:hypothetical protein